MIDHLYTYIDLEALLAFGARKEKKKEQGKTEHIVCKCCWITTKSTLVFPPNSHKSTSNFHVIMYWGKQLSSLRRRMTPARIK